MFNKEPSKSSPEYSFYHKVAAFFAADPDIEVSNIYNYEFTITVFDAKKYNVLKQALCIPQYPGDRLKVNIVYKDATDFRHVSDADLAYLLKNNEYFSRYSASGDGTSKETDLTAMKFVLMKPVVVQYYDDIFNNPYGVATTTAEALAKELFYGCKCNITTDLDD